MDDEKTSKLLQDLKDLANHAQKVASEINEPPPRQSIHYSVTVANFVDADLRNIKDQLSDVASAIDKYLRANPTS